MRFTGEEIQLGVRTAHKPSPSDREEYRKGLRPYLDLFAVMPQEWDIVTIAGHPGKWLVREPCGKPQVHDDRYIFDARKMADDFANAIQKTGERIRVTVDFANNCPLTEGHTVITPAQLNIIGQVHREVTLVPIYA